MCKAFLLDSTKVSNNAGALGLHVHGEWSICIRQGEEKIKLICTWRLCSYTYSTDRYVQSNA